MRYALVVVLVAAVSLFGAGCRADAREAALRPIVVSTHPHDRTAFTEGLEVDGTVRYESTGEVGRSRVEETELGSGRTLARADLAPPDFGEGITMIDDRLWEITWRDHDAIERDPHTLAERRRVTYAGEGWGLCHRHGLVVMSNGTNMLTFRDPVDFAPVRSVRVRGRPVALNALTCADDGSVYADAFPTDRILRIDPDTGAVLESIDASSLRTQPLIPSVGNVLNGIAQLPGTDRFLVTGKYWPIEYEVRFVKYRGERKSG